MLTFYRDIKLSLLTLSILISGINIFAQNHVMHHYGVEDGLPSSEVYSAFQDSKGYMWFATDAGVSRFNGYEFENFDVSDGLTDNTVFLITEDHRGRIWFGTFNNQLCYFDNGTIFPFQHNDKLMKLGMNKFGAVESFAVDSEENVLLGYKRKGVYKVSKNGKVEQLIDNSLNDCDYTLNHFESNGANVSGVLNRAYTKDEFPLSYHRAKRSLEVQLKFKDLSFRKKETNLKDVSLPQHFLNEFCGDYSLFYYDELFLIRSKNGIMTKQNIEISISDSNRIFSVNVENDLLWICIENQGVYLCKIVDNKLQIVNHFFSRTNVSRVFADNNGGYWFMTLTKGVYYLPSKEISFVAESKENAVLSMVVDTVGNRLFLGFSDGRVKLLNDSQTSYSKVMKMYSGTYSLLFDYQNMELLIGWSDSLGYLPSYKEDKISYKRKTSEGSIKDMAKIDDELFCVGTSALSIVKKGKEIYRSNMEGEKDMWCSSVIKFKDQIWIGTKEGIRIYSNKKMNSPFSDNTYLTATITSLAKWSSDVLLIGTKGYGLLVVKNDRVITRIAEENGLESNLVKSLHVDAHGVIWAGTNKGLSRIDYHSKDDFTVKNISSNHGLISEEINTICSYRNTIYLGTPKGLIQFDKTKVKTNTISPPTFITQFNVNSKEREIENNMVLSYKENFIKIHFEALNYRSLGEVDYQYRMLGVDTNWSNTTIRFVQYPTLQANDYQFEVKAKNEDGYWSEPKRLSFSISPPFWLTWWFIILEIILGVGIVSVIFWYREKEIRAKSVVSKKMVELELKALRSQMNPHFIFNTLNSIQHYIAVNDFRSTNKYIVQFANLIRTILNLSEKSVITIQEEIDILTMYMDLEKMRFEEQFDYKIEVSNEIDKDYDEIPSMLLQPYVENAIWHGLMSKKGKGLIKIEIRGEGEYICCSVEDNGIGRKAAAVIKAKRNIKQKSVGMSITKERLDLMSDNEINVETIDLYNDNEEAVGTKMLIRIQYKT
jgi:ligand-binding sensor domain-containing protein